MSVETKICKCGCGGEIKPAKHHKYYPPAYIWGHHRTARVTAWVAENQGKHLCACGCGESIVIKRVHSSPGTGIPKYKSGHQLRPAHEIWKTLLQPHKPRRVRNGRNFTFIQKVKLLQKYNFVCAKCPENTLEFLQFDHIIPLALGGISEISNGQVLCSNCHSKKTFKEMSVHKYNTWWQGSLNKEQM